MNESFNVMPHSTVMQYFHSLKFCGKGEVIMLIFPPRSTVRGGHGRGGKRRFITPVLDAEPQWQSPAYRDFKWSSTRSLVFGLFKKSPLKKLEAEHKALLTKEFQAQRDGDVCAYAF